MKKTLAILLALILATSVAVTACESEGTSGTESQDFEMDFGEDTSSDIITDENGNEVISTDENGSNKDTSSTNNNTSNMETVNDTIYVLHNAAIREKSSTKTTNTSTIIGSIPFGASAKRTAKNTNWSKITYTDENGATIEGYVSNQLITVNAKTVNFVKQEIVTGEGENQTTAPVVSKLKAGSNYRLREYPLANGFPHAVTIEIADEKGQVAGGTEVTVLSVSEDKLWAKIKVEAGKLNVLNDKGSYGTADAGDQKFSTSAAEGYVPYSYLEIAGSNSSNSNDGPMAG